MTTNASVRQRVLRTAADLFYREGVRAVGVDAIVAASGVAKTSLYRHFVTKDDLVAAFVEEEDREYWDAWDAVAARHPEDARAELESQLSAIARHVAEPGYRGCPFLNVVTEFPERDHPGRIAAVKNKSELRRRLRALAERLGVHDPGELADALVLLVDGAYVNASIGKKGPARALVPAAAALVDGSPRSKASARASRER